MNKSIGTLITALLILLFAGLAMCATPEPVSVQANDVVKDAITMEPVVIDGHGTGLVIPAALVGSDFVVPEPVSPDLMVGQPPSAWDWRDNGGVTPVKDQGSCGSCYAFATLGMIEGDILVDSGPEYDFSEEQSKECIWEALYTGSGSCNGGWADWVINLLTRVGIVLEADDPYNAYDTPCNFGTTPVERVTDWYMLSGNNVPPTDTLKGYVYNNGPIFTAFDAHCLPCGYDGLYVVSGAGYYDINHAVVIVGWNDSLVYEGGQGAWIVKNSWGTDFGDEGYFYIAYGGAQIGSYSSVMGGYEGYQANVRTENYDESGWKDAWSFYQDDAWGLCKFDTGVGEEVTAIEFWTTGSTSDVDLYLYDSFDGTYLGTQLYADEDLSFNEPGYHSVEVDSPVVSDGEIVVVAHINNINSVYPYSIFYPIVADYNDNIESGKTYISPDGSDGSWTDLGGYGSEDVALRIRVCGEPPEIDDVWVDDEGGCYTAGSMVTISAVISGNVDTVVADFSAHGIEDPVVMELEDPVVLELEDTNGGATYSASVQITQSCDDLPVTVIATDIVGRSSSGSVEFCVNPGEPDHLNIESFMSTELLMHEYWCVDVDFYDPDVPWWNYPLYVDVLGVYCEDAWDNQIPHLCCDQIIDKTGSMSTVHVENLPPWWDCEMDMTLVLVFNNAAVETCTLTARCEEAPMMGEASIDLTFHEPILGVNMTADTDELFHNGDCSCDTDSASIQAQIVDQYGDPIELAGVPMQFIYTGYEDAYINSGGMRSDPLTSTVVGYTDESGIAYATLYIDGEVNGTIEVHAYAECNAGTIGFDILDPVCYLDFNFDPDGLVAYDGCGEPECMDITLTCMNQYGNPVEVEGIEVWVDVDDDCDYREYDLITDEYGKVYLDYCATDCIGTVFVEAGTECIEDSDNFEVVEPVLTSINLTPDETPQTMILCEEKVFTATCYNQNDGVMCCPDDLGWIYGENVTWDNGTLTATSVGSDTVWVTTDDGTAIMSNEIVINVIQGDVARLEVEPEMIELELCSSAPITVTCYNDHDCEVGCGEYEVDINPPEIASYSDGYVTGDTPGEATLTVTSGEGSDTVDVIVTDTIAPEVSEVVIDPSTCCIDEEISICALVDDCSDTGSLIVYADETLMSYEGDGYYCCDYMTQEGTNDVNVTAEDASGNMGYNDSQSYLSMNLAPDIMSVYVDAQACPGDLIEVEAVVEDDCTDPEDLVVKAIIGEAVIQLEYDAENEVYSGQPTAVEGVHCVNVTAEDEHGGLDYDDTQCYDATNLAPDISEVILSPTSCRVGDTITVNATVSDDCTDAEDLIVKADGKNLTYTDGYFIGNFSAVEGTHNVTVIAEDGLEATGENDSAQYTATKKKVKTSSRGGGGGSSGGTYPPNWDKPKTTGSSSNATQVTVPTPTPTDVPESPTRPDTGNATEVIGGDTGNVTGNETDDSPPDTPGFAGVFVILGILVVAYLHYRKKQ